MRASQRAEQAELGRVGGCGRRLVRHMMTRFEECEYLPRPPHDRCGKSRQPPHMDAVRPVGAARLEPMQEHDFVPRLAHRHVEVARVSERSEEHTSELQSHSDLVCRLLPEKKNKR